MHPHGRLNSQPFLQSFRPLNQSAELQSRRTKVPSQASAPHLAVRLQHRPWRRAVQLSSYPSRPARRTPRRRTSGRSPWWPQGWTGISDLAALRRLSVQAAKPTPARKAWAAGTGRATGWTRTATGRRTPCPMAPRSGATSSSPSRALPKSSPSPPGASGTAARRRGPPRYQDSEKRSSSTCATSSHPTWWDLSWRGTLTWQTPSSWLQPF